MAKSNILIAMERNFTKKKDDVINGGQVGVEDFEAWKNALFVCHEHLYRYERAKRIAAAQGNKGEIDKQLITNAFDALQGVIDLIIEDENGDLLLYDYKTDRLTPAELLNDSLVREKMTERHAPQLKYYKEAVRRLFGKECKASFVYSTHAAKEFEI